MNKGYKKHNGKLFNQPLGLTGIVSNKFKAPKGDTFYSIKDGSWSDLTTWETVSGRSGKLPTQYDDVIIRHNINQAYLDGTSFPVFNLYINLNCTLDLSNNGGSPNSGLSIYGDIFCKGNLNITNVPNGAIVINFYGTCSKSYVDTYAFSPTLGRVTFRYNDRNPFIIPLNYPSLFISPVFMNGVSNVADTNTSIAYLTGNTSVAGTFSLSSGGGIVPVKLECGQWDFTAFGTCSFGSNGAVFSKNGNGNLLFVGSVSVGSGHAFYFDLSGNADIEFRGSITGANAAQSPFISGTGKWKFTTGNQSAYLYFTNFEGELLIDTGIELTTTGPITFTTGTVNGPGKWINTSTATFATQFAAENSIMVSSWDFTSFANTISFAGNYTANISSAFNAVYHLSITGTGTKAVSANTTVNGNLSVGGIFDFATYTGLMLGTSNIVSGGNLTKSGAGNLTFTGVLSTNSGIQTQTMNFSGNPDIEFKNGITFGDGSAMTINTGTGNWNFTTNNQSIYRFVSGNPQPYNMNCKINIVGAITLSFEYSSAVSAFAYNIYDTLNGTVPGSQVINRSKLYFYTTTAPMTTGTLDITTFSNTVGYMFNGAFSLPYSTYRGLAIAGTGLKSLSTNTSVETFTLSGGKFDCASYNFSVSSTTSVSGTSGEFYKTGVGTILFTGLFTWGGGSSTFIFDLSGGNPDVEFKNGILYNDRFTTFKTGTGTWKFSTNSQSISNNNGVVRVYDCAVLVSGAITLTLAGSTAQTFTGVFNGDNAGSTIDNRFTTTYNNATRPMVTGVLQTNAAVNTFIYGNGNQNITGGTYRNLTFNGTGVKTLQGNVIKTGTYVLTAPATVNLNGFTLT